MKCVFLPQEEDRIVKYSLNKISRINHFSLVSIFQTSKLTCLMNFPLLGLQKGGSEYQSTGSWTSSYQSTNPTTLRLQHASVVYHLSKVCWLVECFVSAKTLSTLRWVGFQHLFSLALHTVGALVYHTVGGQEPIHLFKGTDRSFSTSPFGLIVLLECWCKLTYVNRPERSKNLRCSSIYLSLKVTKNKTTYNSTIVISPRKSDEFMSMSTPGPNMRSTNRCTC